MKKSFLLLLAAPWILASCSNDDLNAPMQTGEEVEVTFEAALPSEILSRAEVSAGYGNGETATNLTYAVYDKDGEFLFEKPESESLTFSASLHCPVKIRLVSGETYKIAFWAQNSAAPYTFDATNKKVTCNYNTTTPANNAETLDAFYVLKEVTIDPLNPQLSQEAEMTRATAQINIATADKSYFEGGTQAGLWPGNSKVTLKGIPEGMDLLTGDVIMPADPETAQEFSSAALPTGTVKVNGKTYDYLSLTYVLAAKEGSVLPLVTMEVDNQTNGKREYKNIPVRRNWQTNIVGNLLTSETLWDVYITPGFEDEHNILISTEAELIQAIKTGGSYTLTTSLEVSGAMIPNAPMQLDLNNNTLTIGNAIQSKASNSVTLENGNVDIEGTANAGIIVSSYAELVLNNVNLTTETSKPAISSSAESSVVIDGTTVTPHHATAKAAQILGEATITNSEFNGNGTSTILIAYDSADVTMEGTTVNNGGGAAVQTLSDATLTLKDCHLKSTADVTKGSVGLSVLDDCVIKAEGCTFEAPGYGVTTTASPQTAKPTINLTNCIVKGQVAFVCNLNGTVNLKDCDLQGQTHALLARGGTYVVDHCTMHAAYPVDEYEDNIDTVWVPYYKGSWKTGGMAAVGTLTMGNHYVNASGETTAYKYPTKLTLKNGCELSANHTGAAANKFYLIYAYANQGDGLGVTFVDDGTNIYHNETCLSPYNAYGSANITVNGEAATITTYPTTE